MRIHAAIAAATISMLAGCQGQEACHPQEHCLAAGRVQGACQCTEWEVVRSQVVDLPYLVATIIYPPGGNQSSIQYGGSFQLDPSRRFDLAPVGTRWRTLVRDAANELAARAVSDVMSQPSWRLDPVTPATLALTSPAAEVIIARTGVDVPDHARDDRLAIWVNPRATVETDWAGGHTVRWSGSSILPECGSGAIRLAWLRPGQLLNGDPADDPCAGAFLASLDQGQRAELAAFDVFYSPEGAAPQSIFDSARYFTFLNTNFYLGLQRTSVHQWACVAPPSDLDFQALARSEHVVPGGLTLIVEHTMLAAAGPCADRALALAEETTSPGCDISTALELDVAFGTVFHVMGTQWPTYQAPACTR